MKFRGEKLRKLRLERKLSTYSASRELWRYGIEISHQTLINWEKGIYTPACSQMDGLCRFYKKDIGFFFS